MIGPPYEIFKGETTMDKQQKQASQPKEAVPPVKEPVKGLVFDIQGHSVHDGPGTRTTVFMAGCPLECVWCCNPEGLFTAPVLMHRETKCVRCGRCVAACPVGAVQIIDKKIIQFNRDLCDQCKTHECAEACLKEANVVSGKYYTIDELMKIFTRDRQFWGGSGGVTFSGGEPLFQKKFMLPLLKRCKDAYIHVAVETTSCLPSDYYMEIMRYIDWVFTDIKHMDPIKHKELTGVDNALILKNIRNLGQDPKWNGFAMIRIPIIPDTNDSDENVRATAKYVKESGFEVINILPFHRLGESKYRQVGKSYRFAECRPPSEEKMNHLKAIIEEEGLVCYVGYKTPF